MSTPLITFAIPYYKGREYLRRALRSLLQQDCPDWLAVVVDDRGGEDAEDIVIALDDSRVTFCRNSENLGLARNWNKGIELASTELVTLFHADDELEPWYVSEMIALMNRHPDAVAGHCRTVVVNEDGQPIFSLPDEVKKVIRPRTHEDIVTVGEDGLQSLMRGAWIFCPTLCFRKTKFPANGFSERWRMVLDLDLTSRILMSGGKLVGTPKVSYRYRRHGANQTSLLTAELTRFREEIAILDEVAHQCEQRGWSGAARTARRKTIVRLHLCYQAVRSLARLRLPTMARMLVAALRAQV